MSQAGTKYWFKGQPLPGVDQTGLGASAYWFNGQALPFVSDAGVSTVNAVGTAAGVGTASATGASTAAAVGSAAGVGSAAAVSGVFSVSPIADVSDGTWTDQDGGTSLYAAIDETTASDTDYIKSANISSGNTDVCEVLLDAMNAPSVDTNHSIVYRYRAQGTATMNLIVALRQGGSTQIASVTHNGVGSSYVDGELSLSEAEAAAITDYTDLRLRFTAQAA